MADDRSDPQGFSHLADEKPDSMLAEFWGFMRERKKWWLTPIVLMLLLLGVLVVLGGTAAAPFIYTLF